MLDATPSATPYKDFYDKLQDIAIHFTSLDDSKTLLGIFDDISFYTVGQAKLGGTPVTYDYKYGTLVFWFNNIQGQS